MRRKTSTWWFVIRALCVIAFVAVGFSHRVPAISANSLQPGEIAALTLPDGSLPELCLPGAGDDDGQGPMADGQCEACVIAASALLPLPVDTIGAAMPRPGDALLPPRVEALHRQLFPPNAAPRAPPLSALA